MNLAPSRIGQLGVILNSTARSLKRLSSELVASVANLCNFHLHASQRLINWLFSAWSSTIVWLMPIMLATCCRHVPVYRTCCASYGIIALQKCRWRTFSERLRWRRHHAVLQNGPAYAQQPASQTWRVLMKMQENWLLWIECAYTMSELFSDADDAYFLRILSNKNHVLQIFLPERQTRAYSVRVKTHSEALIDKTTDLNEHNFLIRVLHKDSFIAIFYVCICLIVLANLNHRMYTCTWFAADKPSIKRSVMLWCWSSVWCFVWNPASEATTRKCTL